MHTINDWPLSLLKAHFFSIVVENAQSTLQMEKGERDKRGWGEALDADGEASISNSHSGS